MRKDADTNNYQLTNILLDKGAKVNVDGLTNTALIAAIFPLAPCLGIDPFLPLDVTWHNATVFVEPHRVTTYQRTPEKRAIIEKIIDLKADVNCRQLRTKATPLMYAAVLGDLDIVKNLLNNKARVSDVHNENHKTALGYARERGHRQIVELLETALTMERQQKEVKAVSSTAQLSQFCHNPPQVSAPADGAVTTAVVLPPTSSPSQR